MLATAIAGIALLATAPPLVAMGQEENSAEFEQGEIGQHPSVAIGEPWDGALMFGVKLPPQGEDFFSWDMPLSRSPNRAWRRWGADGTVATVLRVLHRFRLAHPDAPRIGIADLSRRFGGKFGRRFGGLGHASHQNGLDADILYPRLDGRERRAKKPAQIDPALAQELVSRFVRAGAQYVFVGPNTGLRGPKAIVQPLSYHDDHMHVRFPASLGAQGS